MRKRTQQKYEHLVARFNMQFKIGDQVVIKDDFGNLKTVTIESKAGWLCGTPVCRFKETGNYDLTRVQFHESEKIQSKEKVESRTIDTPFGELPLIIVDCPEVVCDFCYKDWTNSDVSGGFVYGSSGVCPDCAPAMRKRIDPQYIRAECRTDESHKDFILRFRMEGV